MNMTEELLKQIVKEETEKMLKEYGEKDQLYFQFMDGARDEVALLNDEDKKTLDDIGNLIKALGISPAALRKLYSKFYMERILVPFQKVLENVEAGKDEDFQQARMRMADKIYPKGSRKD